MILQPRIALLAAAIATTLVACSDDNPSAITGENTLISNASFPVLGANGSDLTAVNQNNFPIPGQLPLTSDSSLGSASPAAAAEVGVGSGIFNDSDLGAAFPDEDFFQPESSAAELDVLGVKMGSLFESIGGLVIGEYEIATGGAVFSDGTLEISKRLAPGCDSGQIESLLNLNGTSITEGTVEFSQCERAGTVLTGILSLTTVSTGSGEVLVVDLLSIVAQLSSGEVTLTGSLTLEFIGDEVAITSDSVAIISSASQLRWEGIAMTGRIAQDGERSLSGVTTLANDSAASPIDFTFTDVVVPGGDDFPASGVQNQVSADGSRLDITYGANGPGTFNYEVIGSNGSTMLFAADRNAVQTRVPF